MAESNSAQCDASSEVAPGGDRLRQLDGLRALAFASVFVHHAFGVPLLWVGVDVFFVLSGFLITGILLRQLSSGSERFFSVFYFRRAVRILPPYFLVLGLVWCCFPSVRSDGWYWYAFFISNVRDAFLPHQTGILGPMWSLALEEQFYLLWPVLVYLLGPRRLRGVCLGLLLAAPAVRLLLTLTCDSFAPVYHLLPARIDLLAAGALMAGSWHARRARCLRVARFGPWLAAASFAIFAALAATHAGFRTSANDLLFNTVGYSLIGALAVATVATTLAYSDAPALRWLSSRPLVYLGTISYMTYLTHKVFLVAMRDLGLGSISAAAAALTLTLLWSAASWHLMERPLRRYKDRVSSYSWA